MIFKGENNQTVELKINGYQFPNAESGSSDSEWLNIFIDVKSNLGNWHRVDPSLTVSEFKELIHWFKDLSVNKKVEYPELYFIEPNLEFDLTKNENMTKNIKIIFYAESKPDFSKQDQEYFVEFKFSNAELDKISNDLEKELKGVAS